MATRRSREQPCLERYATAAARVPREDDFNFTLMGEPLTLSTLICPTPAERYACGCGRCFSGVESQLATTYGAVETADDDEFRAFFRSAPHVRGWVNTQFDADQVADVLWADVEEIARLLVGVSDGTEVRPEVLQETFALIPGDGGRRVGKRSPKITRLIDANIADRA